MGRVDVSKIWSENSGVGKGLRGTACATCGVIVGGTGIERALRVEGEGAAARVFVGTSNPGILDYGAVVHRVTCDVGNCACSGEQGLREVNGWATPRGCKGRFDVGDGRDGARCHGGEDRCGHGHGGRRLWRLVRSATLERRTTKEVGDADVVAVAELEIE